MAATNAYTVQTTVVPTGTLTVKIWSSSALLTVPPESTVISISPVIERMDSAQAGLSDIQQVTFKVFDNYSTHAEGFWYKALNLDFEIELLLNEGSGDTYVFWGRPIEPVATFTELSLVSGAIIRMAEFTCASVLTKLKDVTVADMFTEADTHEVTALSGKKYIKLQAILASMTTVAFGQGYSTNDIIMAADDFKYKEGANYWTFTDLSLQTEGTIGDDRGYRVDWPSEYSNCYDLLGAICRAFGFYPEYYYDTGASKHRIRLITRGRSYSTPLTIAVPEDCSIPKERDQFVRTVVVEPGSHVTGSVSQMWITGNGTAGSIAGSGDLPAGLSEDVRITILHATSSLSGPDDYTLYYLSGGGAAAQKITSMQYYNYTSAAFSSDITPSSGEPFLEPMLRYVFERFKRGSAKKSFERGYFTSQASDGSTTTHSHIKIGNLHSIDDGVASKSYYITGYEKDVCSDVMRLSLAEV